MEIFEFSKYIFLNASRCMRICPRLSVCMSVRLLYQWFPIVRYGEATAIKQICIIRIKWRVCWPNSVPIQRAQVIKFRISGKEKVGKPLRRLQKWMYSIWLLSSYKVFIQFRCELWIAQSPPTLPVDLTAFVVVNYRQSVKTDMRWQRYFSVHIFSSLRSLQ